VAREIVEKPAGMINYHTMATMKVAVTLDTESLREVDRLVREGRFPSRSRAVQAALVEMLARRKRSRLAEELAKLDFREERALAEETLSGEPAWPEY
jgi:Arc/MetJ-type ribon-helix-helix transcriptional regulator